MLHLEGHCCSFDKPNAYLLPGQLREFPGRLDVDVHHLHLLCPPWVCIHVQLHEIVQKAKRRVCWKGHDLCHPIHVCTIQFYLLDLCTHKWTSNGMMPSILKRYKKFVRLLLVTKWNIMGVWIKFIAWMWISLIKFCCSDVCVV